MEFGIQGPRLGMDVAASPASQRRTSASLLVASFDINQATLFLAEILQRTYRDLLPEDTWTRPSRMRRTPCFFQPGFTQCDLDIPPRRHQSRPCTNYRLNTRRGRLLKIQRIAEACFCAEDAFFQSPPPCLAPTPFPLFSLTSEYTPHSHLHTNLSLDTQHARQCD